MGADSKISWTDHTFNIVHGCTRVSPGCLNCYADATSKRWGRELWGKNAPRKLMSDAYWREPLKWNKDAANAGKRRRVFLGSMCDWAEDHAVVRSQHPRMWELIRRCEWLDFLMLSKRADLIAQCLPADWGNGYHNVWPGTSVEDQKRADERIPHLLRVPAVVRFLSCEPLLSALSLRRVAENTMSFKDVLTGAEYSNRGPFVEPVKIGNLPKIHWVIVGGESGPNFRPMNLDWARALRDECAEAKIPLWFKQISGRAPGLGEDALGEVIQQLPAAA